MLHLSADVGGTFVDIVLIDSETKEVTIDKVPSTKTSATGILEGMRKVLRTVESKPDQVQRFVHGFTIATNAWLTHSGADVTLLVTKGFKDILEIGTQRRPGLYILANSRREPLVPRSRVIEVEERLAADGGIDTELSEAELQRVVDLVAVTRPEAIAISLLFSYLNPVHEDRLRKAIALRLPNVPTYLSSETNPQIQEYVRTNTTVAGAYVGPPTKAYVESLIEHMDKGGFTCPVMLMRSDGGVATPFAAIRDPVTMLLSGPAGGVIGAAALGRAANTPNLITFDMGGTSADFSLIYQGEPKTTTERFMNGQPLRTPMLDIETISAGGGSIGFVDPGGALRIGPDSAGSIPGPACYGRGGKQATLTDATVWLGLIDPNDFAGGDLPLNRDLAGEAIERNIAGPLKVSREEAAWGMISVACAQMRQAIRTLSVERGHDIRDFSLLAFGGAGSIFATLMQGELGLKSVLIPPRPGVFAAFGLLLADIRHNLQRPFSGEMRQIQKAAVHSALLEMQTELNARLAADGVPKADRRFIFSIDLRYVGQFHNITIPFSMSLEGNWWQKDRVAEEFHKTHKQLYGHSDSGSELEAVGLRCEAIGQLAKPDFPKLDRAAELTPPVHGPRRVIMDGSGVVRECPVYLRSHLRSGHFIEGPAVVSQKDTTIFILANQAGRVDDYGNIHVKGNGA